MKIHDVITALDSIMAKHGNVECVIGNWRFVPITKIQAVACSDAMVENSPGVEPAPGDTIVAQMDTGDWPDQPPTGWPLKEAVVAVVLPGAKGEE